MNVLEKEDENIEFNLVIILAKKKKSSTKKLPNEIDTCLKGNKQILCI